MKRLMIGLAAGALVAAMLPGAVNAGGGKPVVVGTYDSNGVQGFKIRAYVDKAGLEAGYFDEPDFTTGSLVVVRRELADVCVDGDLALLVSAPYDVSGTEYFDFLYVLDDRGRDLMKSGGGLTSVNFVCEDELQYSGGMYPIDKGGIVVH
jgi:hypothetical protein